MKCDKMVSFLKYSHIYIYIAMYVCNFYGDESFSLPNFLAVANTIKLLIYVVVPDFQMNINFFSHTKNSDNLYVM